MQFNLEQTTKDFINDVKKYLEKAHFEPMVLRAVFNAIDNHEHDIKDSVCKYFALVGIEDRMTINVERGNENAN